MRPCAALAAVALSCLVGLATAAPDAAARTMGTVPDRRLRLTVSGSEATWIRGVELLCPPTADVHHPQAVAACAAVDEAAGDLDGLLGDPHPCAEGFDPVTVTATGTWDGVRVEWRKTFPSACTMDAVTGPLFRF
ncbi:SSI family serine proteinase inhibitor [Streptomyces sp. NPDC052052]|uniref:SSI family serine proteinase inhibitor n=1 Tax=Streptomyces sp. NPDC052052 TaxID=3154756 RepID=UPI00343F0092